uniref:Uncharacterized protein n=1 Tax=Arundo donax TaxID=35708 RepID=A0A0A9C259_ARUDO
MPPESRVL